MHQVAGTPVGRFGSSAHPLLWMIVAALLARALQRGNRVAAQPLLRAHVRNQPLHVLFVPHANQVS